MRYAQLRAFHYVAVSGGFSLAADALHLTQPAISDQVKKLESAFDIRLFHRQNKSVELTEQGKALLAITHRLFDAEQQALELLDESRALRSGTLRIIADSAKHITAILAKFRQTYPGVSISVRSGNSHQVIEQLDRYEADIGVSGDLVKQQSYRVIQLDSSPIVAFAAKGTVFSQTREIDMTTLAQWPLVMREQGSRTRSQVEEFARSVGITLNTVITAEGREAVRQIVADGGGVGIVSEAEFDHHQSLAKIHISDMPLYMQEYVVCLRVREKSRLIQQFMSLARASVSR